MADMTVSADNDGSESDDRQAIQRLINHYNKLRKEVHLPFLDTTLLDKYVVQPAQRFTASLEELSASAQPDDAASHNNTKHQSDHQSGSTRHAEEETAMIAHEAAQRAQADRMAKLKEQRHEAVRKLVILVGVVTDHKQRTLDVLETVTKRETILKDVFKVLASRSNSELGVVEASVAVQHNLHLLQKATLAVIERCILWRQPLPFPHPFMVGPENYLLKIMEDTQRMAANAQMTEAVPMQALFLRFPLYSNLPALGKYAEDPTRPQVRKTVPPPVDVNFHKRLIAAEDYLHEEIERQMKMLKQLTVCCQQGYFVPVLDLKQLSPPPPQPKIGQPKVILPHPAGVKIYSRDIQQRLEQSLMHCLDALVHPAFEKAYLDDAESKKKDERVAWKEEEARA